MRVHRVYFGIAACVTLVGLLLLSVWAPWHQVFLNDSHRVVSLPRAPIWSESSLPGAGVNLEQWLLEAALILAVAVGIVKIGLSTRTKSPPPKQ